MSIALIAPHTPHAASRTSPRKTMRFGEPHGVWRRHAASTIALAALLCAPAISLAEPDTPVEVAMVSDVSGRVERRVVGVKTWTPAALESALFIGDGLRTFARSLAEVRFVDDTLVVLDERTRLRISVTLFDLERAPREIRVALAEGRAGVRAGRSRVNLVLPDGATHDVAPGETAWFGTDPPSEADTPRPDLLPVEDPADFDPDRIDTTGWLGAGATTVTTLDDPFAPDGVLEPGWPRLGIVPGGRVSIRIDVRER